jgi:hypothetical protein
MDEWRVTSNDPKDMVKCTICNATFRLQMLGSNAAPSTFKWAKLVVDFLQYAKIEIICLLEIACLAFLYGPRLPHESHLNYLFRVVPFPHCLFSGYLSMILRLIAFPLLGWSVLGTCMVIFDCFLHVVLAWSFMENDLLFGTDLDIYGIGIIGIAMIVSGSCLRTLLVIRCLALDELSRTASVANRDERERFVKEHVVLDYDEGSDH